MTGRPAIRPMAPGDLAEVVELCVLHAEYENQPYREDGQAGRLHAALFGEPPLLFGWVVDAGDHLAGYMTAVTEFATRPARSFVYMDTLYLREPWRGRGLGRALMETLAAFAAERGLGELQWQTPPDNASGIAFYRRIGARELAKSRFVLPVPADGRALAGRDRESVG